MCLRPRPEQTLNGLMLLLNISVTLGGVEIQELRELLEPCWLWEQLDSATGAGGGMGPGGSAGVMGAARC